MSALQALGRRPQPGGGPATGALSRGRPSNEVGGEEPAPDEGKPKVCDVGVALFDNPNEFSSGWASKNGGTPFAFSQPTDLASDTIWVVNLAYDEYMRSASKMANFRRAEYLRTSINAIGSDLGMRSAGRYASETVSVLAGVVHRAVGLALECYGWGSLTHLREDQLVDDIRRALPQPQRPPSHCKPRLLSAFQALSKPVRTELYPGESLMVTLRRNRLAYAQTILSSTVPDDAWTYIDPKSAAGMNPDDLVNPAVPTLVEAAIELDSLNERQSALIAFGAGGGRRAGAVRRWVSQPELAWLMRFCRVRVTGVLVSATARPLAESHRLPARLTADPLLEFSASAGLVAECHWSALATATFNRLTKSFDVTSTAVWLRAVDRAACFALAHQVESAGFMVSWYGNGSVGVNVARDRLPALIEFARTHDISMPCFNGVLSELGYDIDTLAAA